MTIDSNNDSSPERGTTGRRGPGDDRTRRHRRRVPDGRDGPDSRGSRDTRTDRDRQGRLTARRDVQRGRRTFDQPVELRVLRRDALSDHMVRVVFDTDDPQLFDLGGLTDTYVKLLFANGVKRTYTIRSLDTSTKAVAIDFVVHGVDGVAGPWAAQAAPGMAIHATGVGGTYRPDPEADWYLLAGDESALPAIGRALEALPRAAKDVAVIETADGLHRLPASAPDDVEIVWVDRPAPGTAPTGLAAACTPLLARPGRLNVFAHGERESIKLLRNLIRGRSETYTTVSISGYWALGATEDSMRGDRSDRRH